MQAAIPAPYLYEGSELEVFQHAVNWKAYFRAHLRAYLHGDVLEVGGGIGATARLLCQPAPARPGPRSWTSLEPDANLATRMEEAFRREPLPVPHQVITGTLAEVSPERHFDAIIYIDVLEHIEHDRAELERAAGHLRPGGSLVVLAPAHQWLYTPFDHAIGHFRRYSRRSLGRVGPPGLRVERLFYLDSVGLLASLANKLLLRSAHPTLGQIRFWDRVLVRLSRLTDPLTGYRLGKTVVAIWRLSPRGE